MMGKLGGRLLRAIQRRAPQFAFVAAIVTALWGLSGSAHAQGTVKSDDQLVDDIRHKQAGRTRISATSISRPAQKKNGRPEDARVITLKPVR